MVRFLRFMRWFLIITSAASLPLLPLAGYLIGKNTEEWNIQGLEQSPGISHDDAVAMTWHWRTIYGWIGFVIALVYFLISLYLFVWGSPKRDPKLSSY